MLTREGDGGIHGGRLARGPVRDTDSGVVIQRCLLYALLVMLYCCGVEAMYVLSVSLPCVGRYSPAKTSKMYPRISPP